VPQPCCVTPGRDRRKREMKLGGPQGWSGRGMKQRKSFVSILDGPAPDNSLYHLHHPDSLTALKAALLYCRVKYEGESHENLKLHDANGAAIFTLLLCCPVAFLQCTAICRPLFKP